MADYDIAIIGGGSAGLTAATIAGRVGARVVLVDKERLGGDCLYYGCVPSKAFIKAARVAHTMRRAERFGLQSADPAPDIKAVLGYVWDAIHNLEAHDSPEALEKHGVETVFGGARFVGERKLQVGDREIEAERFILAVGSHAAPPPIKGLQEAGYLDHVKIFHLEQMPKRLVVIGGGPIGIELGQSMSRLGAEVTVLQAGPRILPREDAELGEMLGGLLADELDIQLEARVTRVEVVDGSKRVFYEREGKESSVDGDEILVAVGRAPNLDGLDLDKAGVEHNARGIIVDGNLRTTNARIWAAGDCTGAPQFTHLAEAQARTAARNALFRGKKKFDDQGVPRTTFSDPELAHVGLTEAEAKATGKDARVYRFSYENLDRAVTEGEAHGLAKVVVDKKGRILGGSLLGPGAGEALGELVLARREGITLDRLASTIHVYPTLGRIVRRVGDQRFIEQGLSPAVAKLFGRFKATRAD